MNALAVLLVVALFRPASTVGALGAQQPPDTATLEGGKACVLPFTLARHFIIVDVRLGDEKEPRKFIFDTGINLNFIDKVLAGKLKLAKVGELPATDSSGAAGKMSIHVLNALKIGDAKIENAVIGGMDLATLSRHAGVPISGILGDNALRKFCVQIDYRKKRITLSLNGKPATGKIVLKAPKRPNFQPIAVPIRYPGGEAFGIIDTGAHDVEMPLEWLRAVQCAKEERLEAAGAMTGGLMGSGGGDVAARIAEWKVGDFALKSYPVFSVRSDKALIGYRFLSQFLVTIDYPHDTVILDPYADANFPTNSFSSGLALTKHPDGRITVTGYWKGSPADKAGLRLGDEIVSLAGKPAKDFDQTSLSARLSDPEPAQVVLVVKRSEGTVTVTVVKANLFPAP